MQPLIKILIRQKYNWPISALFFGGFFLFLRFCIGTELIYHYFEVSRKTPFFKTGWLFLQNCLSYPRGLAQYLAAFLTQLCYFPWTGALAITVLAWGIYRLTASLTAFAAESPWRAISYVPAILLLMICGRYENPISMSTAVLAVAFFSVLYQKISPRLGQARAILFLVFSGILYYVAGIAVLVFVVLAALCELFIRRKPVFSVFYLLLGPLFCWLLGVLVFKLDYSNIYLFSAPFVSKKQILEKDKLSRIFEWALLASIPAIVLIHSVFPVLYSAFRPMKQKNKNADSTGSVPGWIVQTALLVVIAVPGVLFSYDFKARRTIQVSCFACRSMWPEVLAIARKGSLKQYFPFCNSSVNRALYYTGRLGDEMFSFPQDSQASELVLYHFMRNRVVSIEHTEACMDLGLVNVAEEAAYEFMSETNDCPFVLKQLAFINIVKGQIETARIYLGALSRNLVYRREARDMLRRLEADPKLESDQRVQYLRQVSMKRDIIYFSYDEGYWLEELLRANRHNKMAFEYLMAYYLLNRNLDKFIENLPRLDDFDYKEIPRHYQEAVLIYKGMTQKDIDLGGRKINTEIVNQFNQISEIVNDPGNSNLEILKRKLAPLAPKFKTTYFFYYIFRSNEKT